MSDSTNAEKRKVLLEGFDLAIKTLGTAVDPRKEALRRYPDPTNPLPANDLIGIGKRDRELLRAGFVKGAEWHHRNRHDPICMDDALAAATLAYPDPYEPTIVTDEDGDQYRIRNGVVERQRLEDAAWHTMKWLTPSLLAAFGDIAREYYEHERTK